MSQENVEIVRQTWNAYNERGIEAVLGYVAEDWVGEQFPDGIDSTPFEGKAGVVERYRVFTEAWGDLVFEPVEFIDAGDNVVAVVVMRGTGASGAPIDVTTAFVYEIRDGEIVRDRPFTSREQALEALGLRE